MSRVLDPEGAHLAALRRLQDFTGARVVEVGCGDGRLTPGIAEHAASVLAFDPDEIAVARARAVLPDALAGRVTYRVDSASRDRAETVELRRRGLLLDTLMNFAEGRRARPPQIPGGGHPGWHRAR